MGLMVIKPSKGPFEHAHPTIKLGGENQTHEALVHEIALKKNGG